MIERSDINSVLAQMRTMRSDMQQAARQIDMPALRPDVAGNSVQESERTGFTDLLKSAVDQVNSNQKVSNQLRESYERGDPGVDLPQVMIQAQKASISYDALLQVRNRLVRAYEDVSKMPI